MKAHLNYGLKHYHHLYFGVYEFINDENKIADQSIGGSLRRLREQRIENYTGTRGILQFGNIWAMKASQFMHENGCFIHPDVWNQKNIPLLYWDNPGLPHLLYRGLWNPHGYNNWCRLTRDGTNTKQQNIGGGARKINGQLKHLTEGSICDWRDIVGGYRRVEVRGKKALICPSSGQMFKNYYGVDVNRWIEEKSRRLKTLGYEVEVRGKPGRPARERAGGKLYERLHANDIALTVSCHSVGALESIIAGVPTVVEGAHHAGELGTPWEEFAQSGDLRLPRMDAVEDWVDQILCNVHHKSHIYTGQWLDT